MTDRDPLAPGEMLGDYRIERKLGEGGMGIVLAAVHPLIGKRAAIKVLMAELCTDPQAVARFIDEARVVNQIGHPNIVDVFTFGETADGRSYFIMEWLKGESLRERVDRSRMSLLEIGRVMPQLIRALSAAHDAGVIHRDLKPDNVFLVEVANEPAHVKLLDFGIAKLSRADRVVAASPGGRSPTSVKTTASGALVGTPTYMSPEQAGGMPIERTTDIYALGALLFELLTGRPPFVSDNVMTLLTSHLMDPPPRVRELASVPVELDELVARMLAKDPAARPSLVEVGAVIKRAAQLPGSDLLADRDSLGSITVTAWKPPAPSAPTVITQPPANAGLRIAIVAALIVATVVGVYAVAHRDRPQPAETRVIVAPVAAAPIDALLPVDAAVDAPIPIDATVSLDATHVLHATHVRPDAAVVSIDAAPVDHDTDLLPLTK